MVRYKGAPSHELIVREIIERGSLAGSKIDISFMSPDSKHLLGLIEGKALEGKFGNGDTKKAIKQTLCYSILPLAYSIWGALKAAQMKELISLLIFPGRLYRLKLTKSDRPFGYCLEIEMTDDRDTMNHVLDEYVDLMKDLFIKLERGKLLMSARVCAVDWSPVNFDFEEGVDENDKACFEHNLGFVFRAKAGTVKRLLKILTCIETVCSEFPADDTLVVVKYHSAILDLGCSDSQTFVEKIILQTINEKKFKAQENIIKAQDDKFKAQENIIARLMAQLKIQAQAGEDTSEGKSDEHAGVQSSGAVDSGGEMSGSELKVAGLSSESSVSVVEAHSILHPYIAMMKFSLNTRTCSFLVMKDTGPTLHSLMPDAGFQDFWSKSEVRKAFFEDVGLSALNLEKLQLCHNDIRPPNITVKNNRFCLIDFDNCRQDPVFGNSPVLKSLGAESNCKRMMFSVAQIGIVVFKISILTNDHKGTSKVIREVNRWLQGKRKEMPVGFEAWVGAKGIERVFLHETRVRDATYDRTFMELMLRGMLGIHS